jgi:predicted ATPase/tRNA A-37 threonylcarbamoyl transferase component Bud32/HPt (histidine-containing phosphotransfer) domain-containing protein
MLLERYELGERLAESDRNTVRRVRRVRDGAKLVIKTSTREHPSVREVRRLEFEYHILRRVQSAGVIAAVDIERDAGRVALVLEDFGGERLSAIASRGSSRGVGLDVFFPVAAKIVSALGHIHACGVMHKDINPGNILINPGTRELKLIDFSIASELSREHLDATPHNALEGTLPYLSPEQTGRMNRDLDYRSDYYSLGITFFELLTGSLPFSAQDVLGYIHCHLSRPAPDAHELNPELPIGLARIVAKLMAKNPDDRYQSARGLAADLEHCRSTWQQQREVAAFELGTRDVSERFQVSQALLGREQEAARLLSAFERAAAGPAQLLLVSGYSGIGKSTLISEIHKPVVEKRAHFAAGKFEQLERNLPYGALLQALRGVLKQILSEPERQLLARRDRLRNALGNDAAVLFPFLPELSQILGPQPSVAELSAREAQSRLQRLFRGFLRAIATAEQPLVLFLDDLQWTDGSTPQLLAHLLGEEQLRYVCFIGAYRDNEVTEGHLLRLGLDELKAKRPELVHELSLRPLAEASVEQIVAGTLHCQVAECRSFAQQLFQKTGGNPFFVHELLHVLHRQGGIQFSAERGAWIWHEEVLQRAALTDNVVDLVLGRLRELPADTLTCLGIAACLGKEFDLGLLARIAGKTPGAVATALWQAVERELLLPRGEAHRLLLRDAADSALELADAGISYQFPHDRVVEAAYALLDERQRAELHLRIGREIQRRIPGPERAERVFDFIDHLNRGRSLLTELSQRLELAELNHAAGSSARRSAAYAPAIAYLERARALLSDAEWQGRRDLDFACRRMTAECLFLSGRVERAQQACEELFGSAPDAVSRASAFVLKAAIQEQQSQLGATVDTIRQALAELGVELPSEPSAIEQGIGAGIGKMLAHLERVAIEDLVKLPAAKDPLRIAAAELLFQIIPAASQINPPLFILAELILFDMALTHGTVPGSAKNVMDCGIVFSAILKDYSRAYRMGRAAFKLLERSLPTPLESSVNFVFGCFISHWGAHYQEGLDALARGYQRGIDLGDTLHASYSIVHQAKSMLFAGKRLDDCATLTNRALAYCQDTGAVGNAALPHILRRALGQLTTLYADTSDVQLSDAEFSAEIEKTQNGHFLLVLGQTQTLTQLILGDLPRAAQWDSFATKHLMVGNGAFPVPDYYLLQSLLLARQWAGAGQPERQHILAALEQHRDALKVFGAASPANYQHKHLLVSAELARLSGASIDEVLRLHRDAVQSCGDDFPQLRALAQEALAEFWKERGHPEFARECLLEAYHLYRHWGATAKLAQLERTHGKWLRPDARGHQGATSGTLATATATASLGGHDLDVASALKATLAISSEVKPARLFAVLMQTIIENVGAAHGYLILKDTERDELRVVARAAIDEEPDGALRIPLESCTTLSREMVRFVARTHETLVLDDASRDESYEKDPYVSGQGVKSALCMPILNQGRLLAVLYAENNAVARAFTHARLLFLRVLAGQAAVSIANANLYDRLEAEVAERTRELSERSREVSAMLNSLEQGVFLIDDRLRIQPRYSAHLPQLLGTPEIAGRDCMDLLFRDSNLNAEGLDKVRAALEFSFGVPVIFAQVNKSHWVREFQRAGRGGEKRSFEVDWTLIADDDDKVQRILVALRDVTLLRQMSAKAAQHARDLDYVGQILDAGVEHFQRFCSSARSLMQESEQLLESVSEVRPETRDRVFRGLHTIKGNARLLGLSHLANTVHLAEDSFDSRQGAPIDPARREQLRGALASVLAAIGEYERIYQDKLASVLQQPGRADESAWQAIAARLEEAKAGLLGPHDTLTAIESVVRRAGSVRLSQLVQQAARLLPVLAQELGKPAPALELEDRGISLSGSWARPLSDCLVHVFQNALDHGLETAEQRLARHKPARGTLRVRVQQSARGASLRIADDGRGLNLAALRARAGVSEEPDEQTAQRIFDAGVSTAAHVTQISGRGVGLDAVRALLRGLGGDVSIALGAALEPGFRAFELNLELPAHATLDEPARPSRPPAASEHRAPLVTR